MNRVRLKLRREVSGGSRGGGRGRSFGRGCGGGPEFCKPLPGWQQNDSEDHTETEDSRRHRKARGQTGGALRHDHEGHR